MKNILYISASHLSSNQANSVHVVKMCQAFAHNNIETTLVADKGDLQANKSIFERFGVRSAFNITHIRRINIRALWNIPYSLQCALISKSCNGSSSALYGRYIYGLLAASLVNPKTPVMYESHSLPSNTIQWLAEKWLLRRRSFKKLVTISQTLKDDYLKHLPYLSEKDIVVAHDGADIIINKRAQSNVSDPNARLNIGYVGKLSTGKGLNLILEIAKHLPEDRFHIFGGSQNDVKHWQDKAQSNNLLFYGHIDHNKIPHYIDNMDVLLAPLQSISLIDKDYDIGRWTSPLKIFEYMAAQKAIIASKLPVLEEIIENKSNGLLASPDTADEWVAALNVLADNTTLRQRLADNAFDTFKNNYTWNIRAKNILKNLLA